MKRKTAISLGVGLLSAGLLVLATLRLGPRSGPIEEDAEAPRRPSEWGWVQRTYPYFDAAPDAYRIAFEQAVRLRHTAKRGNIGTWRLEGPTSVGGRIVDVAFDPQDPHVVYAAAATGGVFKSTDAGDTWTPIFDDQPVLSIGDVAVDPTDGDVVYVGTGEANGGHNNFAGTGLYKSTDGGRTWRHSGLGATQTIGRVRVDPERPQRVFVAAVGSYFRPGLDRGLYRSEDGGATWTRSLSVNDSTGVIDFVMRPDDPDQLIAAAWQRVRRPSGARLSGAASGLYRSDDGGRTWQRLGVLDGLPSGPAGRIGLALCRDVPNVVYALYTDGTSYLGLYRSDDGGRRWHDADPDGELRAGFRDFSWYFGQVRVHPTDPDVVFVLDVLLSTSRDGGDTWTTQGGTHVDHHALAFSPSTPVVVIEGNDGGLARSRDGGRTWASVGSLPVTQFYEIAVDPSNASRFYGGTQDNGTLRSPDDGTGDWETILGGDGFYVIVDPRDSTTVYAESQRGHLVKITQGTTAGALDGIPSDEPRNWSTPVVMDPNDPDVLYYGTNRLYRTDDGAQTWKAVSDDLTKRLGLPLVGTVSTIAVAPSDSHVIYAGTDDGNVWVSLDRGVTSRHVTHAPLPDRWVTRVVVDPVDPAIAYATFSGLRLADPVAHVFRTTDFGATWTDISSDLPDAPVNALVVDPRAPSVLYVGSDVGAFATFDGGASWEPLGEGLPAVSVYALAFSGEGDRLSLVAGTHGRSMYRLPLGSVALAAESVGNVDTKLQHPYPNPFDTGTTFAFDVARPARAVLEVFDVLGRRVGVISDAPVAPGTHVLFWSGTGAGGVPVSPGTYLVRLSLVDGDAVQVRTTTVTRAR